MIDVDVLAEVIATARVTAQIYGPIELRPPWAMRFDRVNKAGFHVVQRGACWLRPSGGGPPIALAPGDVVFLPRAFTHTVADRADRAGQPYLDTIASQAQRRAEPATTVLLCGAYELDDDAPHPLVGVLPHVLHAVGTAPELRAVTELLAREVGAAQPGAGVVARRLLDVLFVYVLRAWLASQPDGAGGWLGALRDAATQRALSALHAEPARAWTQASLARATGVSRATLTRHFTARVGEPPLTYLRRWRMTLAAQALRERDVSLGELAGLVGYSSEVAFHKAFSRVRGVTPAEYRRAQR